MKTLITAALIAVSAVVSGSPAGRPGLDADREAVIGLEREWLGALHDGATLERVLADDFVHPVPSGDFLLKSAMLWGLARPKVVGEP